MLLEYIAVAQWLEHWIVSRKDLSSNLVQPRSDYGALDHSAPWMCVCMTTYSGEYLLETDCALVSLCVSV